jgi:hypothetical protein
MTREEAASPTVSLESVLITAVIDAKENREVAVVDMPNAFVTTENEKLADHHEVDLMKIRGKLVDILVQVDPELYGPYVTYENGQKILYVEILRALYGMIKSPLLYYRHWRSKIESIGFEINPYDPCTANLVEDGVQLTLV